MRAKERQEKGRAGSGSWGLQVRGSFTLRMMLVEIGERTVSPTELALPKPPAAQGQAPTSPWHPPHNEVFTLFLRPLPTSTDRQLRHAPALGHLNTSLPLTLPPSPSTPFHSLAGAPGQAHTSPWPRLHARAPAAHGSRWTAAVAHAWEARALAHTAFTGVCAALPGYPQACPPAGAFNATSWHVCPASANTVRVLTYH